ncbi:MAG: hypothetical protein ACRCTW_11150 [Lactococcus garvieae]
MKQYIANMMEGELFIHNGDMYTIKVPFDTDVDPQALNHRTGNIETFNPYAFVELPACESDDFD